MSTANLHHLPTEHFTEFIASQHVDDKVARGVDGQQHVGHGHDFLDEHRRRAAVFDAVIAEHGLVDVGHDFNALTHDEHDDDADEDQGHVHLLALGLLHDGAGNAHHFLLKQHRLSNPTKTKKSKVLKVSTFSRGNEHLTRFVREVNKVLQKAFFCSPSTLKSLEELLRYEP